MSGIIKRDIDFMHHNDIEYWKDRALDNEEIIKSLETTLETLVELRETNANLRKLLSDNNIKCED